jgi:beta-phosphoglucomutase-like phosphatase (HAD superfamily)
MSPARDLQLVIFDCDGVLVDLVKPPRPERVIDEGLDGVSHGAATLRRFGEPAADAGRTVLPGDAVESDHSDDPAILDGRGLNAAVAYELLAGALDEGQRVLGRLPVRPR